MRGRRGQRGGRGRGRVRGQSYPQRRLTDQGSEENNNEDSSRPPTPQPQDGEPEEIEVDEDEVSPAPTVPTPPAPRTLARLPSMPLQVSLRARKGLHSSPADSEMAKENNNLGTAAVAIAAETPNTSATMETSGHDGSSSEVEDRQPKRRRILENGSANAAPLTSDATPTTPTRGRGRGRGRARGRARAEVGRPRGSRGRGRGRGSRGGPGSRGGRGAYRTRGRGRGGRGGSASVRTVAEGPVVEAALMRVPEKEDKEQDTTSATEWYSGVTGTSYRNPLHSKLDALREREIKLAADLASLEDLKKRNSDIKDRFKVVAKLIVTRHQTRASKTLKELKTGRDVTSQAPWAKEIYGTLDDRLETHLSHLDGEKEFKQINGVQVFQNSCKIVQRSFEISMGEWMDRCVVAFIREKRDISELWKVRDPYLNQWILRRCGINRTENVTMTDLIETFMHREGRDRCRYDRPQLATRTNEGLFDRKVSETCTARARRIFGECIRVEKASLMTPPQSPGLEANNTDDMEIDSQILDELLSNQSIYDRLRDNDKPGVGKLDFVLDHKYDPKNPAQVLPPRRYTTREAMAVDSLVRLKEGIELDSEDEFDKYSEGDYYYDDEDEIMSVDKDLLKEKSPDQSGSGKDHGNRELVDRESEMWDLVPSDPHRSSGEGRESSVESEREEVIVPSPNYLAEPKTSGVEPSRERSPSSGPLTSKHFDFVLTPDASSQDPVSYPARAMEDGEVQMLSTSPDLPQKANGHPSDKLTPPIPGNGTLIKAVGLPQKRLRDGSEKVQQDSSKENLRPKLPDIPKPPNDRLETVKPPKRPPYDAIYPGVSTGARHPFLNDRNFDKPIKGNNVVTVSHSPQKNAQKLFTDPPGFSPVLMSSSSSNGTSGTAGNRPAPSATFRARGSSRKEPGRPGRKPNNPSTPLSYVQPEYPLQGKGRILSPKPPQTPTQMGYPPTGYPASKFTIQSNSTVQPSYLKPYAAATAPSPLRSQSRPPYDPRDSPNPTWAGASYSYTSPGQSSSPYPPSGEYNYDPSRSSVPPQAPYHAPPVGYGPYGVPGGLVRNTPGPTGNPFQSNNSTQTPYNSQPPYFTPPGLTSTAPLPPPYQRQYPPSPSWGTSQAPSTPAHPRNGLQGKHPYEGKAPQLFTLPPTTPTPSGPQQEPVKYYVGDGVYKTAPSTIERLPSLTLSQGTVFEEDNLSKNLNQMARDGNWGSGTPGGGNPGSQGTAL
ncbi:hypothetical protein P167DRAFT_575205 [Morchella conica CCBAS932]|uniref:Uncharacterized protein n=1 Tax=Morchella conica CCBAS932 TaxID=1392247 RepID=A0A3N4KSZ7_9PEZI|nr:hypothetical protein P167DRAFT_575205 [Morchella conica CCBAS932]